MHPNEWVCRRWSGSSEEGIGSPGAVTQKDFRGGSQLKPKPEGWLDLRYPGLAQGHGSGDEKRTLKCILPSWMSRRRKLVPMSSPLHRWTPRSWKWNYYLKTSVIFYALIRFTPVGMVGSQMEIPLGLIYQRLDWKTTKYWHHAQPLCSIGRKGVLFGIQRALLCWLASGSQQNVPPTAQAKCVRKRGRGRKSASHKLLIVLHTRGQKSMAGMRG